jgi:anti-sigma regulatory factor (Ser/Thr protein kinase)
MTVGGQLRESYPAVADSVPSARDAVTAFAAAAGAGPDLLECVRLAVSEALTNAVVHAYGEREGSIVVSAQIVSGELKVQVADEGAGLHFDSPHGLGLGMALMALSSDTLTIERRSSGGMQVQLGFSLTANGNGEQADNPATRGAGGPTARSPGAQAA